MIYRIKDSDFLERANDVISSGFIHLVKWMNALDAISNKSVPEPWCARWVLRTFPAFTCCGVIDIRRYDREMNTMIICLGMVWWQWIQSLCLYIFLSTHVVILEFILYKTACIALTARTSARSPLCCTWYRHSLISTHKESSAGPAPTDLN